MQRLSSSISDELYARLKEIAVKDKRSISFTVENLLNRMIKEIDRKKKSNG
jgi:predicted transcriptional regulator